MRLDNWPTLHAMTPEEIAEELAVRTAMMSAWTQRYAVILPVIRALRAEVRDPVPDEGAA